jgi:hypothetical protein
MNVEEFRAAVAADKVKDEAERLRRMREEAARVPVPYDPVTNTHDMGTEIDRNGLGRGVSIRGHTDF